MLMHSQRTPKIYAACLSAYSAGFLHGVWIDADQDSEDISYEIDSMLKDSPAKKLGEPCEEWAIHDHEGFCGLDIREYESLDHVSELGQAIAEHGNAFAQYYSMVQYGDVWDTLNVFHEAYMGTYDSEKDFVRNYLEEIGDIDRWEQAGIPEHWIDYDSIKVDWFIDTYFSMPTNDYRVFVYRRQP